MTSRQQFSFENRLQKTLTVHNILIDVLSEPSKVTKSYILNKILVNEIPNIITNLK